MVSEQIDDVVLFGGGAAALAARVAADLPLTPESLRGWAEMGAIGLCLSMLAYLIIFRMPQNTRDAEMERKAAAAAAAAEREAMLKRADELHTRYLDSLDGFAKGVDRMADAVEKNTSAVDRVDAELGRIRTDISRSHLGGPHS